MVMRFIGDGAPSPEMVHAPSPSGILVMAPEYPPAY